MPTEEDDEEPTVELVKAERLPTEAEDDDIEVLEGQVIDTRPAAAMATVRAVVAHPGTVTAARHVLYVAGGASVVVKRLWDSRTSARYERMMRAAEVAGNHEAALEWEARGASFRRDRHSRRMDLLLLPAQLVASLPKVAAGTVAVLGAIGALLAIAEGDARQIGVPFRAVAELVQAFVLVISLIWGPIVLAVPWIGVAALWKLGRAEAATGTGWAARLEPDQGDAGLVVTADTVVLALQHLRIPELKRAFKDGWIPVFDQPPVRDGRGYWCVVQLPLGVTAEMVADQRPVLARNLHRAEIEVWPSDAEKADTGPAGALDLWIADRNALAKAAPEYPLLHEGTADVFEGVPGGVSPRGDALAIPIVGNNWVAGGQMGQGKSNSCRVVMLGCALDPLPELWVYVFAANGDFDAYEPRLARYFKGVDDDVIEEALRGLRELYAEVARREDRLAELGAKKVTRQLAVQHPDLRPVVALFSECHELFSHALHGELAAELAVKTMKRARKTAISMGFDTQSSRKEAIPPKLVELVSINACFYVKTWRSNDGFLGDGSFQAGIRATELRPGRDRGTSLITGVSDSMFELLKWYFIPVDDDAGWDAATDVIQRAMTNVAPGTRTHYDGPDGPDDRDLLDDLDEVLGAERIRLADVPALLRDLAPDWAPYQSLTGTHLRAQLKALGVRVTNPGNVLRLDPADLRAVISARSTADLDEE